MQTLRQGTRNIAAGIRGSDSLGLVYPLLPADYLEVNEPRVFRNYGYKPPENRLPVAAALVSLSTDNGETELDRACSAVRCIFEGRVRRKPNRRALDTKGVYYELERRGCKNFGVVLALLGRDVGSDRVSTAELRETAASVAPHPELFNSESGGLDIGGVFANPRLNLTVIGLPLARVLVDENLPRYLADAA